MVEAIEVNFAASAAYADCEDTPASACAVRADCTLIDEEGEVECANSQIQLSALHRSTLSSGAPYPTKTGSSSGKDILERYTLALILAMLVLTTCGVCYLRAQARKNEFQESLILEREFAEGSYDIVMDEEPAMRT